MEKAPLASTKILSSAKELRKIFQEAAWLRGYPGSSTDESTPRVSHTREGMPVGGVVGFTKERCPFQKSRHNQQDWIVITNKIIDFFFREEIRQGSGAELEGGQLQILYS
jgi:hypothetical protein